MTIAKYSSDPRGRRSIFIDPSSRIHVDVFYDRLEFCHIIPLAGRLEADRPTIPIAELLLSKLQIVRINDKDIIDIVLLLLDHPIGSSDADSIDMGRIARLCADDWGLWRTLTQNLAKVSRSPRAIRSSTIRSARACCGRLER